MADSYKNYAGILMPTNAGSTRRQWGTGGADTLIGGGQDDTFYIYSSAETVVEMPGAMATVDVMTWTPYTLPANVTNMTVSGAPGTVTGNALNNLIIAQGSTGMTIDGGGGDDVLVANTGADTFVVGTSGHDVIYNFDTSQDLVRIAGVSSFGALQSMWTQQGQDVVITLSASNSVTLRNTTTSQLSAKNFELAIDTSKLTMTFDDEFNSFVSSPDGSKGWMTSYHDNTRTLSSNHEAEYYSDPSTGVNPFSDSNGILTITAAPAKAGQTPAGSGLTYTSGVITTQKSFSQLYGYFEVRAELPSGQGFWPAFWLLPADLSWPPELDVMEQIGGATTYQTSHTDMGGFNTQTQFATQVAGATSGFHTYGVDWEADKITWYVDGTAVASTATPADMHKPMYMLLNLAVGANGSWPGAADGATSAQYKIDYVRAYSSTEALAATAPTSAAPVPAPTVAIKTQTLAADTGVSASDNITENGAVTLSGSVSGASGTAVTIYDGTTALGTATVSSSDWSFATTLANGTHALHAVAVDPSGQTASSAAAASVTVITAAPVVTITRQVLAADTGASASDGITKNGAVTLSGTVAGASGTTVAVYDGTALLGSATVSGSTWSYATTLGSGTHALRAVATDVAGNTASSAAAAAVTVITAAPTVAITGETDVGGKQTVIGTVTGAAGTTVALYNGASALGAATLDGKGGWSYTGSFQPGTYNLLAVATDPAGNQASVDPTFTVAAAPSAPPTVGTSTQPATTANTLVLSMAEDAYQGDAQFTVSVDGEQVGGTMTVTASHSAGASQDFALGGQFDTGAHTIAVNFLNDAYSGSATTDRNLYVNAITLGGAKITPNAEQAQSGVSVYSLNNGKTPTSLDTLSLKLSEDAYQGDAQFTVSVDGKQLGGIQTVTTLYKSWTNQEFQFTGAFGAGSHDVVIDFLNDAHGSTIDKDRNIHVASIAFDGVATTENATQYDGGAAHYRVALPASATASDGTIQLGTQATLVVDGSAATAAILFAGSNAVAQFTSASDFHGAISGFSGSDVLDLRSVTFSAATAASAIYRDGGKSGVLTVTDGTHAAALNLLGSYAGGTFSAAADGTGGTALTWHAK